MNKTELRKNINKSVYQFVESLGYTMSDDEDGSYVTFTKIGSSWKDSIDYMRSYQYVIAADDCSDEIKVDLKIIEDQIDVIKNFWNKQFELSKK